VIDIIDLGNQRSCVELTLTALKDGAKCDDQDVFWDLSSRNYEACSWDTRIDVSKLLIIKLVSTKPMIADAAMPAKAAI